MIHLCDAFLKGCGGVGLIAKKYMPVNMNFQEYVSILLLFLAKLPVGFEL